MTVSKTALFNFACALAAGGLWYLSRGQISWLPLIIALLPWLFRVVKGQWPWQRTNVDVTLVVLIATAALGASQAYDPVAGWGKWWLLVGALFLYYALAAQPTENIWLVTLIWLGVALFLGIYFVLTTDWSIYAAGLGPLTPILARLGGPKVALDAIHPNGAAGSIVIWMPLMVALGVHQWRVGRKWAALLVAAAVLINGAVLLITTSRGAWLALVVAVGFWLLWRISAKLSAMLPLSQVSVTLILMVVVYGGLFIIIAANSAIAEQVAGGQGKINRLVLYGRALKVIGDVPFLGGGLASFPAWYAQYILVLPSLVLTHAHNVYLDLWFEQGVLGALAFVVLLVSSLVRVLRGISAASTSSATGLRLFQIGVASGLIVQLFHGLVDDPLYAGRGVLFLLALSGLAVAATPQVKPRFLSRQTLLMGATALLGVILVVAIPAWRAQWAAGKAAVTMASLQFAEWPTDQWDEGRDMAKYDGVANQFEAVFDIDVLNRTAHHRLGELAMLGRDFERAQLYLETANAQDVNHQGIHKLLAYNFLWRGQVTEAEPLLATLPEAPYELGVYAWWWETQNQPTLSQLADGMSGRLKGN